jgi:hypothetical protein
VGNVAVRQKAGGTEEYNRRNLPDTHGAPAIVSALIRETTLMGLPQPAATVENQHWRVYLDSN